MTVSTDARASATRDPESVGRMPDFFIVGHPKCGTTALYEMLRAHPQIYMPELKEPWYFADDLLPRFQPPRSAPPLRTLDDYLAVFAGARLDQRVGEASSAYLLSRTAAARIAAAAPDARIVAILREPASFLRSLHLQLLRTHVESKQDLAKALALEPARRAGRKIPRRSHRPQLLRYSDHVRYVEQLRRYRDAFGPEQLLVLIYDDFRADNDATVRRVRGFLGVDDGIPLDAVTANTTSTRMRSQQADELLNIVSVGRGPGSRAVKTVLKTLMPRDLRRRSIGATQRHLVNATPRPPDERLMLELRRRYKPEVVALSEYLDRDLVALWGYDRLD
jgi:Sulfotransferase family